MSRASPSPSLSEYPRPLGGDGDVSGSLYPFYALLSYHKIANAHRVRSVLSIYTELALKVSTVQIVARLHFASNHFLELCPPPHLLGPLTSQRASDIAGPWPVKT